jgi:hypothetical protein
MQHGPLFETVFTTKEVARRILNVILIALQAFCFQISAVLAMGDFGEKLMKC